MNRARLTIVGSFWAYELYNDEGEYIYDIEEAAACAENLYGHCWEGVYTGDVSISRDEYLQGRD